MMYARVFLRVLLAPEIYSCALNNTCDCGTASLLRLNVSYVHLRWDLCTMAAATNLEFTSLMKAALWISARNRAVGMAVAEAREPWELYCTQVHMKRYR